MSASLAETVGIGAVGLTNDLEATAFGVMALPPDGDGTSIASFADKARMRSLVSAIPVRVLTSDIVNLVAAAHCAGLAHPAPA